MSKLAGSIIIEDTAKYALPDRKKQRITGQYSDSIVDATHSFSPDLVSACTDKISIPSIGFLDTSDGNIGGDRDVHSPDLFGDHNFSDEPTFLELLENLHQSNEDDSSSPPASLKKSTNEPLPSHHLKLCDAIKYGDIEEVKSLCKSKEDIELNSYRGRYSLLYLAAKYGHLEILKYFIEDIKFDMHFSYRNNDFTVLRGTIGVFPQYNKIGHERCLKYLLNQKILPADTTKWNEFPLHMAVKSRYAPFVQILLKYGVDPNLQDQEGNTAMHYSVTHYKHSGILELLVRHGADITIPNHKGDTPEKIFQTIYLANPKSISAKNTWKIIYGDPEHEKHEASVTSIVVPECDISEGCIETLGNDDSEFT